MISSTLFRATSRQGLTKAFKSPLVARSLATGPQSGGEISDELLAKLGSLSTQALVGML